MMTDEDNISPELYQKYFQLFLAIAGLKIITGDEDRSITVPDFKAIGNAANSILVKVCKVIPPGKYNRRKK